MRERIEERIMGAVEFADNSPEPPLESLYDNLYVISDNVPGWYAVDERTPEPHPGELEHEVGKQGPIRDLAEAGAAYGGKQRGRQKPSEDGAGSDEGPDEADVEASEALEDRDEDVAEAG